MNKQLLKPYKMNTQNLNIELLLDALTEAIAEKVSDRIYPPQATIQTTPEEEFLDTAQTLEFIKVKTRVTLDKYVYQGRIQEPIQRGGRKKYYRKSDLLNFLKNG
jgi:hypothetical protein